MTRWRVILGAVATLTLVAVCLIVLPASSAPAAVERFRVCDQNKPGYEHDVSHDQEGFAAGNEFLFADRLLDPSTGRKAGHDVGDGTVIRVIDDRDALIQIDAMFFFPNGKISVAFAARFGDLDKGERFPITGGTGHFENAIGSVFIKNHPCNGKSGTSFHFHVT